MQGMFQTQRQPSYPCFPFLPPIAVKHLKHLHMMGQPLSMSNVQWPGTEIGANVGEDRRRETRKRRIRHRRICLRGMMCMGCPKRTLFEVLCRKIILQKCCTY